MGEIAVSPTYRQVETDPANVFHALTRAQLPITDVNTKIELFHDRARGWFIDVAKRLCASDGNAGYTVIQIAASQVEAMQQYVEGASSKRASRDFFVRGMMRVFGQQTAGHEKLLEDFYDRVRCGLFHDGFTKLNVTISWVFPFVIGFGGGVIQINPKQFLGSVEIALAGYRYELLDPANKQLRDNFETRWNAA
jgi:hypothetical protein